MSEETFDIIFSEQAYVCFSLEVDLKRATWLEQFVFILWVYLILNS
jgi:hypothetical protein